MLEEIENIKKDIQEYIEVKLDLFKLQSAENISRVVSNVVVAVIALLLGSLVLFLLSFAAGYFMASLLHSNELGFLCVAGFYILLILIILIFRKSIIDRPVIKSVIKIFFPKTGSDEKN
ncbi:MAG: phage holin family protein [Bacteroidia bacterium]|nr:phage holin family protein [Bacteroidia bacterium]